MSREGFWAEVEQVVQQEHQAARAKLDARLGKAEESGMLAILPPEQLLEKALRAASYHARQVRKSLDDLMAFRGARQHVKPAGENGHQGIIDGEAVVQ